MKKKILIIISIILITIPTIVFLVPFKDGRTIYANIIYQRKVAAATQPGNYDKMKITYARITSRKTGSPNFDTPDGKSVDDGSLLSDLNGVDVSNLDNIIRTYDDLIYTIEVGVDRNPYTTQDTDNFTGGVIKVKVTIPKNGDSNSWLAVKTESWMSNWKRSDDLTTLTAEYVIPREDTIIGGNQELTFSFKSQGYTGEMPENLKPTIEVWMEGNKVDNSSSMVESKIVKDEEELLFSGKQRFKLNLKSGYINRKSTLNGVVGNYINFGAVLKFVSPIKGNEYPYNGIKSKIRLEYYYRNISANSDWIKLDRSIERDRQVLDGIQLVASGLPYLPSPGFWPNENSNKFSDNLDWYAGKNRLGNWPEYVMTYDSGDLTASYSNEILSFENHNNFFQGYLTMGLDHFLTDGFELFIPYYDNGGASYEYQVKLVDYELKGYNYKNVEENIETESPLTMSIQNYLSGNISAILDGQNCSGCTEHTVTIGNNLRLRSVISANDGPYEGGEDRLYVWNSSLMSLNREYDGKGYYNIYVSDGTGELTKDNMVVKYGIYKSSPENGIVDNDTINTAVYNDFDWYTTYDEASTHGKIAAMFLDDPDYRGYKTSVEMIFYLKAIDDPNAVGKVGYVKQSIRLYTDENRTSYSTVGYNQTYIPSKYNENGEKTHSGSPQNVGHTYILAGLKVEPYIRTKSSIDNTEKTTFNVKDKYINVVIYPGVTNLSSDDFITSININYILYPNMTYREGSASIEPTSISPYTGYGEGGFIFKWDLENIKVSEIKPITLQVEMSPFIGNNAYGIMTVGITTPALPSTTAQNSLNLRFVNLSGSSMRENINKDYLEKDETFEITNLIYNISDADLTNVKTIEILPKNNDDRGSKINGSYTIQPLSLLENQKMYYSTNDINNIGIVEDTEGNQTIKNINLSTDSRWHEIELNGTIPANATAIATSIPVIETMKSVSYKYQVIPSNNKGGNKYIFKSSASSDNLENAIVSDILRVSVVERKISGIAFEDVNRDNLYNSGDKLLKGTKVELLDSSNTKISETTTNDDGEYSITLPDKGSYYIRFTGQDGYEVISKGNEDNSSKVNSNYITDLINHTEEPSNLVEIKDHYNFGIRKKATTLTTHHYIKGTTTKLGDDKVETVYYTDEYEAKKLNPIPTNYRYSSIDGDLESGIVDKDNIVVTYYYELKPATVTIKYVDQNGNDIDPSKNIIDNTKHWGDTYSSEQLTFTNYNFVRREGDSASGTISQDNINVRYVYSLKPATVTIKYVDQNGNDIDPSKNIIDNTKHWGDTYSSEQLTFTNYNFVRREGDPASGTISQDNINVRYIYSLKPATLIVKYVDENGNDIDPSKNINDNTKHWGDTYEAEQLTFTNYNYVRREGASAFGVIGQDTTTVTFIYSLKPATITVKYVDINGEDISSPINDNTKHWGDAYSYTHPEITNYDYVRKEGDIESGTISQDNINITYIYKLKRGRVITHHYLYENGEETTTRLADDDEKEYDYTKRYNTEESPDVTKNYEFYKKTDNYTDIVNKPVTEVIYYYQLKDSNLETEITKTGTELITAKDEEVNYKIKYKASIKEYIGNAEVTLVEHLPYKIEEEKSELEEGIYNEEENTITWVVNWDNINTYEETEETYKNEIEKELKLVYKGIVGRDRIMTSTTTSSIMLSNNTREAEEIVPTEIRIPGIITIRYIDENGKEIENEVNEEDLVGENTITKPKEIDGYRLVEVPTTEEYSFEEEKQIVIYKYERIKYNIETKTTNEGGKIIGDEKVNHGENSTKDKIVITADEGYEIDKVLIDGKEIEIKNNLTRLVLNNFNNVKEHHLIEATFKKKNPKTTSFSKNIIYITIIVLLLMLIYRTNFMKRILNIKKYNN